MFKQKQAPLEAVRQICKQQRSPGIKITRGEPSKTSASVLVTGQAERAVDENVDPPNSRLSQQDVRQSAAVQTGPARAGGLERKQRRRENILSQAACFVYIDSSKQLLRNKKTKHNTVRRKQFKPPTEKALAPENNIGLAKQATNSQKKKILTWDENKAQTDGSPKTNGRDIRSARRWNETNWFRRALTSVPPGTEISPGAPPETIRFRVASAQHQ